MARPSDAPVVVRFPWWARLLVPPVAGMFGFAAWTTLIGMWIPWTDRWITGLDDVGALVRVVIGALMVPVAVVCTVAVTAPLMRQTFATDAITMRKLVRTYRIGIADATAIRQVRASLHTGVRSIPIGRLQIIGSPAHGRWGLPPRAALDGTLTHADQAMAVLDAWVRRRPELVAADPGARRVFVDRGVLAP